MPSPENPKFGEATTEAVKAAGRKAVQQIANDKAAAETRMGGVFSSSGLETASKIAELNSQDILRARKFIGLGGSMSTMPMMGL